MEVLKRAQKSNPKSRWWIKADATDMQKGLRESVKREWTGDVDLGDGKKEALHKEYMEKVRLINGLGKKGKGSLLADLKAILALIDSEEGFLKGGQAKAQKIYDKKRVESNVSDATRQALAWDLEGFKGLNERACTLKSKITGLLGNPSDLKCNTKLKEDLLELVKGLFTKKREVASHLLIFMISDELRNRKPYAIPVRFLTYSSITDAKLRELEKDLVNAMEKIGMTVVGKIKYFIQLL